MKHRLTAFFRRHTTRNEAYEHIDEWTWIHSAEIFGSHTLVLIIDSDFIGEWLRMWSGSLEHKVVERMEK